METANVQVGAVEQFQHPSNQDVGQEGPPLKTAKGTTNETSWNRTPPAFEKCGSSFTKLNKLTVMSHRIQTHFL